jgi:hypothetical protein
MKTVKFKKWDCVIVYAQYSNGRTAIQLKDDNDGSPVATATINVPDVYLEKDEVIIKDYSENEGMLDTLVRWNCRADRKKSKKRIC